MNNKPIPVTDPRHPAHVFVAPIVPGQFAEQHARRPHQCADCGLLNRHRADCPSAEGK